MQFLARLPQQRGIGDIPDQSVLEQIARVRWRAALKEEACPNEPLQLALDQRLGELSGSLHELVRELLADCRTDLGDLFRGRAEPIKPSHQRSV